jgi:peptidoglycan hydrolase CwlO-like protein
MHSRKRDFDKKVEDLDERISRAADEADTHKRKNERLARENGELKKQVDTFISKEDRTILQYEKIMD